MSNVKANIEKRSFVFITAGGAKERLSTPVGIPGSVYSGGSQPKEGESRRCHAEVIDGSFRRNFSVKDLQIGWPAGSTKFLSASFAVLRALCGKSF
jgi:hypothetical protein